MTDCTPQFFISFYKSFVQKDLISFYKNTLNQLELLFGRAVLFIVVFNNMKFKPQPTIYVFRCRQSSKRTSRETEVHFNWVERSCLSVITGRFRSILFLSVFHGSLAVAIILIDGSKKPISS